jgi:hypothetical protein
MPAAHLAAHAVGLLAVAGPLLARVPPVYKPRAGVGEERTLASFPPPAGRRLPLRLHP